MNLETIRDQLTTKNIIFGLLICFFPLLMYGIDYINLLLSYRDIFLPTPSGDYILFIVVQVGLYTLLAVGLNIVCGFTGLLDLGYVGFYLVGGYTAGLLMVRLGFSYWMVLPLAVLNGALWGLLRGAPTLRLTGDYFAIVTFGFAELLFRIVKNEIWLIGDINGFVKNIPHVTLFGMKLNQNWHHYYHILILLALVIFVTYRLQHSRVGRAWVAIREDEQAAASMGINVSRYKALAFAVSAAIGGLGGAFLAPFSSSISARTFEFWESILILCMVILGGKGSIKGSVVGAVIIASLSEILRVILSGFPQFSGARYLIFGIILVLLMRYRPDGLIFKKA
ncbi:MAG: branched-chain amino acid ABC transporter permease [Candidatus Poribacteria bacterium]|nr:branched-chain amino acid ABC transporter permease [Candidatus Poribacteria bacterium]